MLLLCMDYVCIGPYVMHYVWTLYYVWTMLDDWWSICMDYARMLNVLDLMYVWMLNECVCRCGHLLCEIMYAHVFCVLYAQFIILVNPGYRRQLNTCRGWAPRYLVNWRRPLVHTGILCLEATRCPSSRQRILVCTRGWRQLTKHRGPRFTKNNELSIHITYTEYMSIQNFT